MNVADFVEEHILEAPMPTWQRYFLEREHTQLHVTNDPDMPLMWFRADGRMECALCGREYRDHVHDADYEWLHVLCNGIGVKT